MAPRHTNPHLIPQSAKTVSRRDFWDEDNEEERPVYDDKAALDHLQELIRGRIDNSLQELIQGRVDNSNVYEEDTRDAKRPRIEDPGEEGPLLFRLVSGSKGPVAISLLQPESKERLSSWEPPAEDSKTEAKQRRKQAKAVAVDGNEILAQSQLAKDATSSPPLLVLSRQQEPRKTRPPVAKEHLAHLPYGPKVSPNAIFSTKACPVIDTTSIPKEKRRRRKKAPPKAVQPQYFRPDPSWRGQCHGYAFGYPSWFLVTKGIKPSAQMQYRRDKLAKIKKLL